MKKSLLIFIALLMVSITSIVAQTCVTPTGGAINPKTACADRVVEYEITGVSNATSYTWSVSGTTRPVTKITDTKYSIVAESSNITITVTPADGACVGTPITQVVTVSALPTKPVITQSGDILTSTVAASYKWYRNNSLLTTATGRTLNIAPYGSGSYSVEVAATAGGCTTLSDAYAFFTTSNKEDAKFKGFTYYPNPVNTVNNSIITTNFTYKYNLEFYDVNGKLVAESKNLVGKAQTDISNFNKGIHLMKITSDGKIAIRKIVIK